jgi:hypothetical protein
LGDEKFRLKWVECKTRINYGGFKEGMKLFSYCSPWCGGYDSHITPIAIWCPYIWFMVLNAIFNNISVISWQSILLVE